jgi:hypothetical protein
MSSLTCSQASSGSPRIHGHKPPALHLKSSRRDRLSATDADFGMATPISSFARRRSPQASPTSSQFRLSSESPPWPLTPVSVPSLPVGFAVPILVDGGAGSPPVALANKDRSRTGLRLSASHGRFELDDEPARG